MKNPEPETFDQLYRALAHEVAAHSGQDLDIDEVNSVVFWSGELDEDEVIEILEEFGPENWDLSIRDGNIHQVLADWIEDVARSRESQFPPYTMEDEPRWPPKDPQGNPITQPRPGELYMSGQKTFIEMPLSQAERRVGVKTGAPRGSRAVVAYDEDEPVAVVYRVKARLWRAVGPGGAVAEGRGLGDQDAQEKAVNSLLWSGMLRRNPSVQMEEAYTKFHGVEPESMTELDSAWLPGPMVYLGPCVDIGYAILDRRSTKEGRYVHDHKDKVKVYRRPQAGERGDLHYKTFPKELWVLGSSLGFTYDDGDTFHEVKGSGKKKLCTNAAGNILVVVDSKGVLFVVKGGRMKVRDWIYH